MKAQALNYHLSFLGTRALHNQPLHYHFSNLNRLDYHPSSSRLPTVQPHYQSPQSSRFLLINHPYRSDRPSSSRLPPVQPHFQSPQSSKFPPINLPYQSNQPSSSRLPPIQPSNQRSELFRDRSKSPDDSSQRSYCKYCQHHPAGGDIRSHFQ
ncbi:unnamed protein product [Mytilus coruscus]|uniref:Uncharacterized protein n=1 Tax=Mytilus coruscus TaxID=42192 RepID=A0A6J8A560_MYTCO|nr:unnamed protein product [Mytilus coruscus]